MKWYHAVLFLLVLLSLQRCANQISPGGGPKDSIPPILINSVPSNNQKNFKGKIVTLNFDEFIKVKDIKEIMITPSPGKNVAILAKAKTVTIEPKTGWKDSTTYSIAFREAIQDITESNPARNLHLAFSTGPVIDSLSISGTVHLALKETIPDRITIALYQQDTFNIFKHSAVYFTESDKEGHYKIENLKPGKYRIYAFADKNKNLKADSQSELYGYKSDTVELQTNASKIDLFLLGVDSRNLKVNNIRNNSAWSTIRLSKPLTEYHLSSAQGKTPLNSYGDNQTEIIVYHDESIKDSVAFNLTAKDSIEQQIDTLIFIKESDAKFPKETFKASIVSTEIATETGDVRVELKFTHPIVQVRKDTMYIWIDSAYIIPIEPKDILFDTATKRAVFTCTIDKKVLTILDKPASLWFSKGVFISINGDTSKAMKTSLPYLKEEETAKLSIEIKTTVPHYIIQIVDKNYKIIQESRNQPAITFTSLKPADYKIRAIIDSNNNGRWDLGSYKNGKEPEKIIYLKVSDKSYDTPLRANWEATAPPFKF